MTEMIACDYLHRSQSNSCYTLTRKGPVSMIKRTLEDRLNRLNDVSALKQGWYDGDEGEQPNMQAVATARAFLQAYPEFDSSIFPMVTGGIELVWERHDTIWCPSLCFCNDGNVNYYSLSVLDASDDTHSDLTDLSTDQLVEFIKSEEAAGRA